MKTFREQQAAKRQEARDLRLFTAVIVALYLSISAALFFAGFEAGQNHGRASCTEQH